MRLEQEVRDMCGERQARGVCEANGEACSSPLMFLLKTLMNNSRNEKTKFDCYPMEHPCVQQHQRAAGADSLPLRKLICRGMVRTLQ